MGLKSILHRLSRIDILRVFSLNAVATLVKMLTGLISVKVVAALIGPAGVALLGQLNNFNSILLGTANGGINNGITKYVAEHKEEEGQIKSLLSNALKITLFFTSIIALALILFHNRFSQWIMMSDEYGYVFLVFGLTIVLYTLNALLISVVNGYKEFQRYVKINISGSIIGVIFSVSMVLLWGLPGALMSAVSYQSVVFFVTLWLCRKCPWFKKNNFRGKFEPAVAKKYLKYSAMTLVTLCMVPVSQMILRGYVISEISPIEAGWWEGMNRISHMYLNIITTSFTVYYLPRLSEIQDKYELKKEIFRCYKVIVPILLVSILAIYLLRKVVIWILFSPEFYPMEAFFGWQLAGDFFKITSWLLAFLMVAKAMTKHFIATEIISTLIFVALGFVLARINGTIGLTQAYLLNYVLYLIMMIIFFKDILTAKPTQLNNETTTDN